MKQNEMVLWALIAISIAVISAVAWHSVEEIHYLKSFYPRDFTVVEAGWAAVVELIKVTLISLPLLIVICLSSRHLKK